MNSSVAVYEYERGGDSAGAYTAGHISAGEFFERCIADWGLGAAEETFESKPTVQHVYLREGDEDEDGVTLHFDPTPEHGGEPVTLVEYD